MPAWRLVVCSQNHDQIGNRMEGERLTTMLSHDQLRLAAAATLLSPFTPMLFMGEEWGASTPWQFFTSHPEPDLGRATAEGRIAEFARMGWDGVDELKAAGLLDSRPVTTIFGEAMGREDTLSQPEDEEDGTTDDADGEPEPVEDRDRIERLRRQLVHYPRREAVKLIEPGEIFEVEEGTRTGNSEQD
jgi:hypothetical protein